MGTFTRPAAEFRNIPMVSQHLELAGKHVAESAANDFIDQVDGMMKSDASLQFDSPLEACFWAWWMAFHEVDVFVKWNLVLNRHVEVKAHGATYVIDFVIASNKECQPGYLEVAWPLIAIELDGHAFHEKTTEQATYRNIRDRALQQVGWQIFHFSYAEFTKEPFDCLCQVIDYARERYWRIVQDNVQSQDSK